MKKEMKVVLENSYMGKEIIEYIEQLEEALDNSCKMLEEHITKTVYDVDKYGEFDYPVPIHTKEEWKERMFKR